MIKNKYVALIYRLFCFIFTLIGLLIHMDIINGNLNFRQFMYYTIQSNLLALVLFGLLAYKTLTDIRSNGKTGNAGYYSRFEMACVVDLLLTLVVYWVILVPDAFSMNAAFGIWSFSNLAVHLFVPLMCLGDYILFSQPGHLKYCDVYNVVIYPLLYVAFTTMAGLLGYVYHVSSADGRIVRFPYFFIDWDQEGAMVIVYILVLVVVFLIISHILFWIDKLREKNQSKRIV